MKKAILIILFGLSFNTYQYSQQKSFGYKNSGNGETISDIFLIQDGYVLDSAVLNSTTYRFEYSNDGKMSRDINLSTYPLRVLVNGQYKIKFLPAYRDYSYNKNGKVDSILVRFWNDSLGVWMDNISYSIKYSYNENGKLYSEKYSNRTTVDEYSYDSAGNLIAIITTDGVDTMNIVREYDLQNRLLSIKKMMNGIENGDQYFYKYDSTGNLNLLYQTISGSKISNKNNYYFEFDESGRVTNEIASNGFLSDSTWKNNYEINFNYDEKGRIIEMGPYTWFHYNADGNLDSMVTTHTIPSGFLANKGTLVDSYGNNIVLPYIGGKSHFYYSKLITGIKRDIINDRTYLLSQNYPNPFNPTTKISYTISKTGQVQLKIYDMLGREVSILVDAVKSAGDYTVEWDGSNYSSGIYFYSIRFNNQTLYKKMLMIK